jgi:hypothetical protein
VSVRDRLVPGSRTDRTALGVWLLSRIAILATTTVGAGLLAAGGQLDGFRTRWTRWDTSLLIEIAQYGYGGNPAEKADPGLPAFFPGFPLLLRAVHAVVPDWTIAAMLITLAASAVSLVALARLGEFTGPDGTGRWATLALVLSPPAVFLFAGYTESLFLAFALPAWLLARRGRWEWAVVCAALASSVRITGLFLALALIVEFVTQAVRARRATDDTGGETGDGRGWPVSRWTLLAVPFLPLVAYSLYLYTRTGDLTAWLAAQKAGWGREMVGPWKALSTTWDAAFYVNNEFTWSFRAELVAAAVGVALTVLLAVRRRWPEFVYIGTQVGALITSSFYLSIPRSALLWWPLWLLLGRLGARHRWGFAVYAAVAGPLMIVYVLTFTKGAWAG